MLRRLAQLQRPPRIGASPRALLHVSRTRREQDHGLKSMLDDLPASAIQVKGMTDAGIELADGLLVPSSCIFLGGKVFLWEVPGAPWAGWSKDHFEIFEAVVPKPEILLLGTGRSVLLPPPSIRSFLNNIGIQLDIMDTRNACSTYNVLTAEGRQVAAALVPSNVASWREKFSIPAKVE